MSTNSGSCRGERGPIWTMKAVEFDTLLYLATVPLALGGMVAVAPRAWTRWLGVVAGVVVIALGLVTLWVLARAGGFFDVQAGGYVGAQLVDWLTWPGGRWSLTLDPVTGVLQLGVSVTLGAGVVGGAMRGGARPAVAAALVLAGLLSAELLVDGLAAVAAAFVLVGIVATLAPLSVLGARPAGAAALRAFALQRAGDGALVLGIAAAAASFGGVSDELLRTVPSALEPWARVAGGLFDGTAHRSLWFVAGAGVAVAAATRLGVLCWPLLRDVTATPDLPPPLVGVIHASWHASAAALLLRADLVMALAPEAAVGLAWAAAIGAVLAGVLSCAGRDILRLDVHLLAGLSAPLVVLVAVGDIAGVGLAGVVQMAAALALPWTFGEVALACERRDPRVLGGLEHTLPRLHTTRLLMTAVVAIVPPFSGWLVWERALEGALFAERMPVALMVVLVVGAVVVAVGAWRALHVVFHARGVGLGAPRGASPPSPTSPPLASVLPVLLLAFIVPGLCLLELPIHLLRLLPLEVDYTGPLSSFVAPSLPALLPTLSVLARPSMTPSMSPSLFVGAALLVGVVPWCVSLLVWRGFGARGPVAASLLETRVVTAAAERLATMAGRESSLARSVSEGAERLSRVLATNLLPIALGVVLQHLPGLLASVAASGLRQLQSGGAQRTVVWACLVLAALLWWGLA
jgi:NADH:ubiquinone oxidoreductase subunit 5 (subunit L)/multisubunit Na+/H+ antiporter MnhA subunit